MHRPDGRQRVGDLAEVQHLEADGGDTLARLRGKRRLRDVRRFAELEALLTALGFVRTHRSFVEEPALHHLAGRYLHLASEAILDIAHHVIADEGLR